MGLGGDLSLLPVRDLPRSEERWRRRSLLLESQRLGEGGGDHLEAWGGRRGERPTRRGSWSRSDRRDGELLRRALLDRLSRSRGW